ncbi:MAG: NADH-quinone oxidoreductase subunit C [Methylophilaceae bacterium]|jgi:NADH-quinone oxidoreductase subunit C
MSDLTKNLLSKLKKSFGRKIVRSKNHLGEITIVIDPSNLHDILKSLRDQKEFHFKQLIDLCSIDYMDYPAEQVDQRRFAVVYHLLSISNNQRLRVKSFIKDNDFPTIQTVIDLWPNADWYEREAFDLFGVMFIDHPDLRRILTDYGFIGHPFRKDFPMIGNVEMRYDPSQKRVIYEPVSIDQRNNVPRVIRDEGIHRG